MSRCGVEDHCCWLDGKVCKYLADSDRPGHAFDCALRRDLGSWDAVHGDPRYVADVRPFWERVAPELDCGAYPPEGEVCAACGEIGRG